MAANPGEAIPFQPVAGTHGSGAKIRVMTSAGTVGPGYQWHVIALSMRHPLHDYTQAAGYFVTTVTADRLPVLGAIHAGNFVSSAYGKIVDKVWAELPSRFQGLVCDALQLMPDHLHGILIITHLPGAHGAKPKAYSLPQVMQALKSISSRQINLLRGVTGVRVWQEGYHDRIIRSEKELEEYRNYIITDPLRTIINR